MSMGKFLQKEKSWNSSIKRVLLIIRERIEKAKKFTIHSKRCIYSAAASGLDKEKYLEKAILEDLYKINLSKKKRKEIITRISYRT